MSNRERERRIEELEGVVIAIACLIFECRIDDSFSRIKGDDDAEPTK